MKLSKEAERGIADELERVSDSKDSDLSLTCLNLSSLPDDFAENIAEIENRRRFKVKSLCLNENRFREIPECVT
jgi:hypothetical protein